MGGKDVARSTYLGEEYIEEFYGIEYLVRVLPSDIVGDFNKFVAKINSYAVFDRCISPVLLEKSDENVYVKFAHLREKPLLHVVANTYSELVDVDDIAEQILDFAKYISLKICPPFPAYSVEDIYTYAGELFFLPPMLFNRDFAITVSNSEYAFVAPEFLKNGTYDERSAIFVLGKIIEFFDKDNKYSTLTTRMTQIEPELRSLEFRCRHDRGLVNAIVGKILAAVGNSEKRFNVVELKTSQYAKYKLVLPRIISEVSRNSNVVFVGNDITNVVRELLSRYGDKIDKLSYNELCTCLYGICKFDNVIPYAAQVFEKLGHAVIIVDDLENSHIFVRRFLSYLRGLGRNLRITVITTNALDVDLVIDLDQEFSQSEGIERHIEGGRLAQLSKSEQSDIENDKKLQLLSVLGQDFSMMEISYLEQIINENFEDTLRKAIRYGIIGKKHMTYSFESESWNILHGKLSNEDKVDLHIKLAKLMQKGKFPYGIAALRSAMQYEYAGKKLSAAVLYMKSIKWNLEYYAFSPTRVMELFERTYELLKEENRLDSYSFNVLRLKFQHHTLQEVLPSLPIPTAKMPDWITVFNYAVNQKYVECIEAANHARPRTTFESYRIEFLRNYAYYSLNDKVLDEEKLKDIVENICDDNIVSAELKAQILLLLGDSITYIDSKEARRFLEKADEITQKFNIRYLLIDINNSYGIVHDGQSISIAYFRKAMQISGELGYYRRIASSRFDFLRALLYFGRFAQLRDELSKAEGALLISKEINPRDKVQLLRIMGFYHMYQQDYEEGFNCLTEALKMETELEIQRFSLRTLILLELICGHLENAKKLIIENSNDPAIHVRGFEYLTKLVLAETNEEFLNVWREYKDSKVTMLREEILYIFAERLAKLDHEGFLKEVRRWENLYAVEQMKLSLFYVLLAKYSYYNFVGNSLRRDLTEWEICRLAKVMEINHPFLAGKSFKEFQNNILISFLEVFKFIDPDISIEDFVRLFASLLFDAFSTDEVYIRVKDDKIGVDYIFSTTRSIPEGIVFNLNPLRVKLIDMVDEDCEAVIYLSSSTFSSDDENETERIINILEETFVSQVKAIVSREISNRDSLTNLYSRWYIDKVLSELLKDFKINDTTFTVFMADIDDFKKVNDTYGHLKGDEVLKEIATIIKTFVGKNGAVGRYGGEEFISIVMFDKDETYELCEKIRTAIEEELRKKFGFTITVSIGIASVPERVTETELMGLADQRLYKAKETGKNRTVKE